LDKDIVKDLVKQLRKAAGKKPIFVISAQAQKGLKELLYSVKDVLFEEKRKQAEEASKEETSAIPVLTLEEDNDSWQVTRTEEGFLVTGGSIERFALRTDFANSHGIARLRDIMKKTGIMNELMRLGIESGDRIIINDKGEFNF
jgi:GTP-binding protein